MAALLVPRATHWDIPMVRRPLVVALCPVPLMLRRWCAGAQSKQLKSSLFVLYTLFILFTPMVCILHLFCLPCIGQICKTILDMLILSKFKFTIQPLYNTNIIKNILHDVISYEWAFLLATSHHWNHSAETHITYCYASMRFDDIIKCLKDM